MWSLGSVQEPSVSKKTIDQVDVAGKRVLMRVDFNVPIKDGVIRDDRRIREAVPTIQNVLDRGGSVVLMSHLGRPGGKGFVAEYSLQPVAERLSELLQRPVVFPSQDCVDDAAASAVNALEDGQVLLLENVRFHKAERTGDGAFASKLAAYGDVYCNDAFGTSHRSDSSMVAVPQSMASKPRVAGLLVTKEIQHLSTSLKDPARPFTAVLGGAKVSDKINAVEHFLRNADHVLIGGAMAYTFLEAMGKNVGESRVERESLAQAKKLIELAALESSDLHLPEDHVCSTEFAESSGDIEVFEDEIPSGFLGLDIGPDTQGRYAGIIAKSKTVVWAGPMGVFEWRPFRIGTMEIANSLADATDAGAMTIVGGGDTAAAAEQFKIANRVKHVSTGGGASLAMLSGEPMPGIEALDDA